ncbi:alpha/beta fold hydrolase [Lacisediminimonas profundi]|uniref:alpha/beta fold hydrolase n=1 Tax=Lacisediminimonas profundi TaxID=2603856 RepID=UPI00124BBBA2|nr:alpha/beta hydrolase [Lacisediminimonas profundi]
MSLRAGLQQAAGIALAVPEIAADAARCRACVTLEIRSNVHAGEATAGEAQAVETLLLWSGAASGPQIVLSAGSNTWSMVFARMPAPGYQSLGALRRKVDDFRIVADELAIAQALPFMERLLERLREALNDGACQPPAALDWSGLRHLHGGYVELGNTVAGADWAYAETCGAHDSPTLLMLHTAGADSRQWHGLMSIAAMRAQWAMHAFDLPGHGRSPLPAGVPNWHWRLTQEDYVRWVIQYMDAAKLERAVLLGCSMGSAIGLALLARHPERFSGAILLEAPYRSPGRRSPYLNSPEVDGGRLAAAWVGSLLSPASPRASRDHATWIYSQSAPGVYDGDLAFYSDDFDARQHTAAIDTARTPLWLLTGDYDYSATPDDTRKVAAEVPGAQFRLLPGLGHFPMVEDPLRLHGLLAEPLREMAAR